MSLFNGSDKRTVLVLSAIVAAVAAVSLPSLLTTPASDQTSKPNGLSAKELSTKESSLSAESSPLALTSAAMPQTLIVKFTDAFHQLDDKQQTTILNDLGVQLHHTYEHVGFVSVVTYSSDNGEANNNEANHHDISTTIDMLQHSQWVNYAEPNYFVYSDTVSGTAIASSPTSPLNWSLHNEGQSGGTIDADIDAPEAWDKYLKHSHSQNRDSVVVALLDSGVDSHHPALTGKLWQPVGQLAYQPDITCQASTSDLSHGTRVASVITSVNPHTPLKLLPLNVLCNNGQGSHASVLSGLDYVASLRKRGVAVATANLSWGNQVSSQAIETALRYVSSEGVQLVVSAGNASRDISQHPHYPAAYSVSGMLSVAASTHDDKLLANSNYSAQLVDLTAPGESIEVATVGGGYEQANGTSLAAAYVSGVSALVQSMHMDLSVKQRKAAIVSGVDKASGLASKVMTRGRLNASAALGEFIDQNVADKELVPTPSVHGEQTIASFGDPLARDRELSRDPTDNSAFPEPEPLELDIIPNHIMMRFTQEYRDLSKEKRQALLDRFGVTIVKDYPYAGGSALLEINGAPTAKTGKLPAGETKESVYQRVNHIVEKLTESGLVDYAEPDHVMQASSIPNDPRYNELWGLEKIQAEEAWDFIEQNNPNPAEIIVGVIDTGVDYTHPDLAANMWVNPGEIPGDGVDNDNNGYIDDVYGLDTKNNDTDPMDDHNHGTHVAGTIAAIRDNSEGIVGVTPNIKIMALKFLGDRTDGRGATSDAIELVNYTLMMKTQYGVDISLTNNSWGGGAFSDSLKEAIEASNEQNILFIAAAGNNGRNTDIELFYPQSYDVDNIISVAATGNNDNLAYFSNYGEATVDIAAPGVSILSTTIDNTYSYFQGTSMAAPHVSGAIALLLSHEPLLTAAQVKERLLRAADSVPETLSGKIAHSRRLNVKRTLLPLLLELDIDDTALTIVEGSSFSVNVRLKTAVGSGEIVTATISKSSGDPGVILSSSATLAFDSTNWDQWQAIAFAVEHDPGIQDGSAAFQLEAADSLPFQFTITAQDDDTELAADICTANTDGIPASECEVLLDLYQATSGDNWSNNTRWLESYSPCSWYGVSCTNNHITDLTFSNNRLNGELPAAIQDLTSLKSLNLSGAGITAIPAEVGNLISLEVLDLSRTAVTAIPVEITNLTNLQILDLESTQIAVLPPEIGNLTQLQVLRLLSNKLTSQLPAELVNLSNLRELKLRGSIPIPAELGNMVSLQRLDIWSGKYAVSDRTEAPTAIPPEIGNLSNLQVLNLQGSNFIGQIPSELGSLASLEELNINASNLSGTIPSAISSLVNLKQLSLNLGPAVTGSIPADIGNLINLEDLSIEGVGLSGVIPVSIGDLVNLKSLSIVRTAIQGQIPAELGLLLNLENLSLINNQLIGSLPIELGNLIKLQYMTIIENPQLTGNIPTTFGNLASLQRLVLYSNQLTGSIPSELGSLAQLEQLQLQSNQLTGSIPSELGSLVNLNSIWMRDNQLSGPIPEELYGLGKLSALVLSNNQLTGPISPNIGNLDNMEYLFLRNNRLEGEIPSTLGNLLKARDIYLGGNRLNGSIPASIARLFRLFNLELSANQLSGEVPSELASMASYPDIYIESNALEVNNPAIADYLYLYGKETQVIPPSNISSTVNNGQLIFSWTPIPFSHGEGEYIISYADTPDGPYIEHGRTENKASSQYIVSDFLENPNRFYVIQTYTPSGFSVFRWAPDDSTSVSQQSDIVSRYSEVVHAPDEIPPVIYAPDMTVSATGLLTNIDFSGVTASDNFDGVLIPSADNLGPFAIGTHIVTWTATDDAGNTSMATQSITVVVPSLTLEATAAPISVDFELIVASYFGSDVTVVPSTTGPFSVGEHEVIWTVTDSVGDVTTVTQLITVSDTTAPVFESLEPIVQASASGHPVVVDLPTPVATDIFPVTIENDIGSATTSSFPVGLSTVVWTATDSNGNSATVEQVIEVTHTAAELTTPVANELFQVGDIYFSWNAITDAEYSLDIGTTRGGNDVVSGGRISDLSQLVTTVIGNQEEVLYVRLNTYVGDEVSFNDYQYSSTIQLMFSGDLEHTWVFYTRKLTPLTWDGVLATAPSNLMLTPQSGQLLLSWSAIASEVPEGDYIISYSDSADGVYVEHGRTSSKAELSYVVADSEVYPGRFYRVQARHITPVYPHVEVISEYSNAVRDPAGEPQSFIIDPVDGDASHILVTWSGLYGDVYLLEIGTQPGLSDIASMQTTATNAQVSGLPPVDTVYLRLREVNGGVASSHYYDYVYNLVD